MAEAVYYLAQHDGGHETVDAAAHEGAQAEGVAYEGVAPGGEHAGGPIEQEPNLSIYTGIAFLLVVYGLYRLVPRILALLDQRTEKIEGDLKSAETSRAEAEKLQAQYEQQLADARAEARRIVEEARSQGEAQARDILAKAQEEAATLKQRAQDEIEADKARALRELRADVADLSCSVASRLLGETVTADSHRALIDRFIDELVAGDGQRN